MMDKLLDTLKPYGWALWPVLLTLAVASLLTVFFAVTHGASAWWLLAGIPNTILIYVSIALFWDATS